MARICQERSMASFLVSHTDRLLDHFQPQKPPLKRQCPQVGSVRVSIYTGKGHVVLPTGSSGLLKSWQADFPYTESPPPSLPACLPAAPPLLPRALSTCLAGVCTRKAESSKRGGREIGLPGKRHVVALQPQRKRDEEIGELKPRRKVERQTAKGSPPQAPPAPDEGTTPALSSSASPLEEATNARESVSWAVSGGEGKPRSKGIGCRDRRVWQPVKERVQPSHPGHARGCWRGDAGRIFVFSRVRF